MREIIVPLVNQREKEGVIGITKFQLRSISKERRRGHRDYKVST
jgi:hypothetical protein